MTAGIVAEMSGVPGRRGIMMVSPLMVIMFVMVVNRRLSREHFRVEIGCIPPGIGTNARFAPSTEHRARDDDHEDDGGDPRNQSRIHTNTSASLLNPRDYELERPLD